MERGFVMVAVISAAVAWVGETPIAEEAKPFPEGRWEFYETPGSGIADMVIEPGNVVWMFSGGKVYYLDGERFREPLMEESSRGKVFAGFRGGAQAPEN